VARAYDYFGDSVLLHDDLLLVGAPGHDGAPGHGVADDSRPDRGGVFAFLREGKTFREVSVFKPKAALGTQYPFPAQLRIAGNALLVPSNTATVVLDSTDVPFAGRVFEFR
jgi:hypothetical protein